MLDAHFIRRGLDRGCDADADHLLPADTFASSNGSVGPVRSRDRLIFVGQRRRTRHRCCRRARRR